MRPRRRLTRPPRRLRRSPSARRLQRDLADWTTFTGQFSAVDHVELRAQVSGYLTEIHFTDGQIVHQGDLLFVIDPRPYEIAAAAGQRAASDRGRPALDLANKEIARTTELQRNDFASGELLDQRVQQQRAAAGGRRAGQGRGARPRSSISNSPASPRRSPDGSARTVPRSAT